MSIRIASSSARDANRRSESTVGRAIPDRGARAMRLRVGDARGAAADSSSGGDDAGPPDAARGVTGGPPDRDAGTENGSKDESFFEAKPWLDSDSEDDFHSVRGDFTPSRGSTPDRYSCRQTPRSWRVPVDTRPKPPPSVQKKQRLFELLQEKQHYDDEDDSATDISSDMESSSVHAEGDLKPPRRGGKVKKPSKPGCFPSLIWKHNFKMCRVMKKRTET